MNPVKSRYLFASVVLCSILSAGPGAASKLGAKRPAETDAGKVPASSVVPPPELPIGAKVVRYNEKLEATLVKCQEWKERFKRVKLSDTGMWTNQNLSFARATRDMILQSEAILKGALAGFRIVEVPVSYHPRIGTSKISGTLKGTAGAAWFILSLIVRYHLRHSVARKTRQA